MFSAWEGVCLVVGLLCGALAVLPLAVRLIKQRLGQADDTRPTEEGT